MAKKVPFTAKPTTKPANLDEWVGSTTADEAPKPEKPKMKRMTYDIPETLHRRLKLHCANNGYQMTDVLRRILEEYLDKTERP
jgi:hypothetical protein